jgi:hypothetical protein
MSTDAIRHVVSTPEVEPTEPTQHTNRASTSSPRFAVWQSGWAVATLTSLASLSL